MHPTIPRSAVRGTPWTDYELLATGRLVPFEGPPRRAAYQVDVAEGPEQRAHDDRREASGAAVTASTTGRRQASGSRGRRRHAPYMYTCWLGGRR